jgi:hypothetical protein
MRAFIDTDSAADTQGFRDVRFAGFIVENNAFLAIANRRAKCMALRHALLWLTIIDLENSYSHAST